MTKKQKNNLFFVVVVMLMLFFAACNKTQPQPPTPAPSQTPKTSPVPLGAVQKQVSSALHVSPPPVNQFDFSNKKDPFKPFVVVKSEPQKMSATARNSQRNSLPIHSFDVSQFKLIGIITGGRQNEAMVTDPGGKGYVLKVGMLIGKNDGRITAINSSGVEILEQFRDDNGRVRKEHIKLTLPRKQ